MFYEENEYFWESGTTSFDTNFPLPPAPQGYTLRYLSDDDDGDGMDEAEMFVYMAFPTEYSSSAEVMYVDEMGGLYSAKLHSRAMHASLMMLFSSGVDWENEDLTKRCAGTGLKFGGARIKSAPSS
jgi:hypothetical protein